MTRSDLARLAALLEERMVSGWKPKPTRQKKSESS